MTQKDQITECEHELLEAIKAEDTNNLDDLIHNELIFNIPTGQTITKEEDINNYCSGILKVFEILPTDQVIKSIDDIATVAVTVLLKAKYADQNINCKFRYLRVWKRVENSWKVIAGSGFQIQ